jgi:hypothetical protein
MVRRLGVGIGLFLIWTSSFGMQPERQSRRRGKSAPKRLMQCHSSRSRLHEAVEEKKRFPVEETRLYKVVTAQHLDQNALLDLHHGSVWINEQDRNGCTPLHHLIRHKDVTVFLVQFLILRGARLDIKNNKGVDPYCFGIIYDEELMNGTEKNLPSRSKAWNVIHSEMLADKLWKLAYEESIMRYLSKKGDFY